MLQSNGLSLELSENDLRLTGMPGYATTEVGYFSMTPDRRVLFDRSGLSILKKSDQWRSFDLNDGFEQFTHSPYSVEIEPILRWIVAEKRNPSRPDCNGNTLLSCTHGATIVMWRGMLRKLGLSLYDKEAWTCAILHYRGVVFFCEVVTEEKKMQEATRTAIEKRMCYWGHSFENVITTPYPESGGPSDRSFITVRRSNLYSYKFLLGCEVDCLDPTGTKYVELKTSREVHTPYDQRIHVRFKHPKWWLQSFLAGIDDIYCGHRDRNGIIRSVEHYGVKDIGNPPGNEWCPNAVLNSIKKILDFVLRNMDGMDGSVYVLEWLPDAQLVRMKRGAEKDFQLPSWFHSEF